MGSYLLCPNDSLARFKKEISRIFYILTAQYIGNILLYMQACLFAAHFQRKKDSRKRSLGLLLLIGIQHRCEVYVGELRVHKEKMQMFFFLTLLYGCGRVYVRGSRAAVGKHKIAAVWSHKFYPCE